MGNEQYKGQDYRKAIELYSKAIELSEADREAGEADDKDALGKITASYYSNRSAAYMMILMYEDSIKDCDSALALDSSNTKVYFRKAKLQVNLGLVDEGLDTYSKGLVRDPNNAQGLKEKDQAVMAQKRMQIAKDCLKKYETNLQKIEGRQALSQVEVVLGICPGWKEAKLVKCLALSAAGRGDEAYGLTTSLMRGGMMNNSELLFVRARCLYSMGSLDECVKHLKQILSGDPDNKKAREEFKRVKVLATKKAEADNAYKTRNFDSAVTLYTEAIEMSKDNPAYKAKLYNNRATAHTNLRNHEECVADCTQAIKLDPDYAKAYNKRAASLCVLGEKADIEKAIQDYEKYASLAGEEAHKEVSKKIKAAKVQLKRASRKDFYKILGVKQDATEAEIKKAYRKSALKHHPDRHANSSEEDKKKAEVVFRDVNLAYEVLSDPKKKDLYDQGVDEKDLDDPNAGAHGGFGGGMGGGHGGIDPSVLFQMFMQQQGGGGGMGGMGGGGFHFG